VPAVTAVCYANVAKGDGDSQVRTRPRSSCGWFVRGPAGAAPHEVGVGGCRQRLPTSEFPDNDQGGNWVSQMPQACDVLFHDKSTVRALRLLLPRLQAGRKQLVNFPQNLEVAQNCLQETASVGCVGRSGACDSEYAPAPATVASLTTGQVNVTDSESPSTIVLEVEFR